MTVSYDLYAETNPAFVAFLLYRFVKSYSDNPSKAPHLSLAYIAVPLAMSERLEVSFASTNATTGFLAWLNRFPESRVGLQRDVSQSRDVTAAGLRAALHSQLLTISHDGNLSLGAAKKPPENAKSKLSGGPRKAVARIERLGGWMSKVGGPALIFSALEVAP
jgi:hypothetical protein